MPQRTLLALTAAAALAVTGCSSGAGAQGIASATTARGTPAAKPSTAPLSAAQVEQRYGLRDASGCGSDASLGITACVTADDPALTQADGISAVRVKVLVFADQASRDAWLADWTDLGQAAIAKGAWWLILRESP